MWTRINFSMLHLKTWTIIILFNLKNALLGQTHIRRMKYRISIQNNNKHSVNSHEKKRNSVITNF